LGASAAGWAAAGHAGWAAAGGRPGGRRLGGSLGASAAGRTFTMSGNTEYTDNNNELRNYNRLGECTNYTAPRQREPPTLVQTSTGTVAARSGSRGGTTRGGDTTRGGGPECRRWACRTTRCGSGRGAALSRRPSSRRLKATMKALVAPGIVCRQAQGQCKCTPRNRATTREHTQ